MFLTQLAAAPEGNYVRCIFVDVDAEAPEWFWIPTTRYFDDPTNPLDLEPTVMVKKLRSAGKWQRVHCRHVGEKYYSPLELYCVPQTGVSLAENKFLAGATSGATVQLRGPVLLTRYSDDVNVGDIFDADLNDLRHCINFVKSVTLKKFQRSWWAMGCGPPQA